MTRHGLVHASAAGTPPPATDPRVSTVNITSAKDPTSLVRDQRDRAEAQRSGLSVSIPTHHSASGTVTDIGRGSKSP